MKYIYLIKCNLLFPGSPRYYFVPFKLISSYSCLRFLKQLTVLLGRDDVQSTQVSAAVHSKETSAHTLRTSGGVESSPAEA